MYYCCYGGYGLFAVAQDFSPPPNWRLTRLGSFFLFSLKGDNYQMDRFKCLKDPSYSAPR
jgi:hypothetical protein